MLILTRKVNESIVTNTGIEIKVVEIRSGQVKLGITAPPEVEIWRSELDWRIEHGKGEERRRSGDPR